MSHNTTTRYGKIGAGIAAGLIAVALAASGAQAGHGSKSETVSSGPQPLPAVGQFQLCVAKGPTRLGKCENTPLLAAGTLEMKVSGTTVQHDFDVDTAPSQCGSEPGLLIAQPSQASSLTVSATIVGTGPYGPYAQTIGPVTAGGGNNQDPVSVYACLAP